MVKRPSPEAVLIFMVVLFVLAAALDLARAHYVYGDWTCAFAKCVKVKEVK